MQLDISNFKSEKIGEAIQTVLDQVKDEVLVLYDNQQKTPYDTGATQNSKRAEKTEKGFKVSYNTDYASDIYFANGRNFKKTHNINAQAHWMEDDEVYSQIIVSIAEKLKRGEF
jgi:hypothetical protein